MRIMLYGSTVLTAAVEAELSCVVGHVPSISPAFPGKMRSRVVTSDVPHDIKLSIQYDRRIVSTANAFNVHNGLLPEYGGVDILHHTLENGATEQGLTFHAMSDEIDAGPIINKISYPVFLGDSVVDLYERMLAIAPGFVMMTLAILPNLDISEIKSIAPVIYKRGAVKNIDRYERDGLALRRYLSERELLNELVTQQP